LATLQRNTGEIRCPKEQEESRNNKTTFYSHQRQLAFLLLTLEVVGRLVTLRQPFLFHCPVARQQRLFIM
jgi:hypothetical protein